MTRISDLDREPFEVRPLSRGRWANGDYVAVEVVDDPSPWPIELVTGRLMALAEGDVLVGGLGRRHATLEATGSWEEVAGDGRMDLLTGGGLLGRCTSRSSQIPTLPRLRYLGHVWRDDGHLRMRDFVDGPGVGDGSDVAGGSGGEDEGASERRPANLTVPAIMIIGTSMSAGKTATARTVIRRLVAAGKRVVAVKVTGAGRYRDVLTMSDSGAHAVFDFVDVGLPSTVCPPEEYRAALAVLVARIEGAGADVAVVEVGASPLEPYNGDLAAAALAPAVRMTILCASDPYAVVGIMKAYGSTPDLVAGIASNTRAGIELVERLTGVPCINVRSPGARSELDRRLGEALGEALARPPEGAS